MTLRSVWGNKDEWTRIAAQKLNPIISGYVFPRLTTAPASPDEGYSYYDLTLHKVRTWDGSAWNNHF